MESKYILSSSSVKPDKNIRVSDMDSRSSSTITTTTTTTSTTRGSGSGSGGSVYKISSGSYKSSGSNGKGIFSHPSTTISKPPDGVAISDESVLRMVYGSVKREATSSSSSSKPMKSREERTKEKMEVIKLTFKAIRASECVDLLFLLDCTGSMDPYINQVKNDITRLQENLKLKHSNLDMTFGFIRYTDFDQGGDRYSIFQFSRSTKEFVDFVNKIRAQGGGDGPEDVFGGMKLINDMNWRPESTRVVIHIADCPCHGTEFHNMMDDHPRGDPTGIKLESLMADITNLNLNYYFGHINLDYTGKMIEVFNDKLKEVSKNQKVISSFDSKDTSTLNEKIFQSVTESISITKSSLTAKYTGKPTHAKREFVLEKNKPDWSRLPYVVMLQKNFHLPSNLMECLKSSYEMKLNEITTKVKMAPNPFAHGAFRIAHYGIDEHGKEVVLKQSVLVGGRHNSLKSYYESMECQTVAAKFAIEFNSLRRKRNEIKFTIAKVLQAKSSEKPTYYGLESFIEGKYEKFNSNAGWKSDDPETAIFQTFSHWTYHVSSGKAMVVDIQGVKTSRGYILTDPCIHSEDILRFGPTNLGKGGMIKFFETHVCNSHCIMMGLTVPSFVKDIKRITASTTPATVSITSSSPFTSIY